MPKDWIKINTAEDLPNFDEQKILNIDGVGDMEGKKFQSMGFLNSLRTTGSGFHAEWVDDNHQEIYNVTHWRELPDDPID